MAKRKSKRKHKKAAKLATPQLKAVKKPVAKKAKSLGAVADSQSQRIVNRSRHVIITLLVLSVLLLFLTIAYLVAQTDKVRTDSEKISQEELLKVQPASPETIQPNSSDYANPQQSAPSPQGSEDSSKQLQPQEPSSQQ